MVFQNSELFSELKDVKNKEKTVLNNFNQVINNLETKLSLYEKELFELVELVSSVIEGNSVNSRLITESSVKKQVTNSNNTNIKKEKSNKRINNIIEEDTKIKSNTNNSTNNSKNKENILNNEIIKSTYNSKNNTKYENILININDDDENI